MAGTTQGIGLKTYDITTDNGRSFVTGTSENMVAIDTAITDKVKINDTPSNVNFILNEIVKDGLVKTHIGKISTPKKVDGAFTQGSNNISLLFSNLMSSYATGEPVIFSTVNGKIRLVVNSAGILYVTYYTDTFKYLSTGINIKNTASCNLYVNFNDTKATIIANGVCSYYDLLTTTSTFTTSSNCYLLGAWDGAQAVSCGLNGFCSYDKSLTSKEIQHNFNVLNNTQSINKINDYAISTDTDHIQDRTGRVQDTINRVFYKQNCKEFTSNGGDVVVNNGMDGYLLSGTIQGQTVKNELLGFSSLGNDITSNTEKTIFTYLKTTSTGASSIYFQSNLTLGKEYTVIINIKENTLVGTDNSILITTSNTVGFNTYIPTNSIGIIKRKFTTTTASQLFAIAIASTNITSGKLVVDMVTVIEGDYLNRETPVSKMFYGLSSTQAVISNMGVKYSFYKDSVDKASGTVITLRGIGGVGDTLEIKEDGSAMLTRNTENIVIRGVDFTSYLKYTSTSLLRYYNPSLYNRTNTLLCDMYPYYSIISAEDTSKIGYITKAIGVDYFDILLEKDKYINIDDARSKHPDVTIVAKLSTPIITYIPKELVPAILTQLENKLTFGDAVAPSKVTVSLPTTDDIAKSYTVSLLNAYTQTVGTATPVVNLLNTGIIRLQMDLTAPSTGMNATLFAVAPELRPVTNAKIPIFINGVCVLGVVDKTTGNVNLPSVPSAGSNIYIKTDYRRDN